MTGTALQYPLVCFDLDGTLVDDTIYIWKSLHERFTTDMDARNRAAENYFAGRISYKEWFEHDLVLLKAAGADRLSILQMLDGMRVMNGAAETLKTLRARGHRIGVISGSIDIVVFHLFPFFTFDHLLINAVHFDGEGQLCGGIHTPYDLEGKADGLLELCRRENISVSQSIFVGDNENDVWIAKTAGFSIAFNCKSEKLAATADVTIREKDLRLILPFVC